MAKFLQIKAMSYDLEIQLYVIVLFSKSNVNN